MIATAGKSKELEINGQIRDREVRLIGADGEQKGVVSIQVALSLIPVSYTHLCWCRSSSPRPPRAAATGRWATR